MRREEGASPEYLTTVENGDTLREIEDAFLKTANDIAGKEPGYENEK